MTLPVHREEDILLPKTKTWAFSSRDTLVAFVATGLGGMAIAPRSTSISKLYTFQGD